MRRHFGAACSLYMIAVHFTVGLLAGLALRVSEAVFVVALARIQRLQVRNAIYPEHHNLAVDHESWIRFSRADLRIDDNASTSRAHCR